MNQDFTKFSGKEGEEIYALMERLFPICRSLTGNGVRETLKVFQEYIPLKVHEIPTGTQVFDWTIPKEWNIKDAYIKDKIGRRIIDFKKNNLHVLGYSVPVHLKLSLSELRKYLYSIPEQPDVIPYRVSYYKERWGFCLTHNQFLSLKDEEYEVCIDSTLEQGSLTYGEFVIPGELKEEVLFSTYICHPSLANDNLSGPCLTVLLAKHLKQFNPKYTYRFIFIPETIGSIAWLSKNASVVKNIKHGLVITCVGNSAPSTYKRSKQGNAFIDRAVEKVLIESGQEYIVSDFWPQGSDERQFCSPGFNLPVGSLMKTPYGRFPEYHTSADNMTFVTPQNLHDTFEKYCRILHILEHDNIYENTLPYGEPQLGKRGLYGDISGANQHDKYIEAQAWVLSFSDGNHSLLDISYKSKIDFKFLQKVSVPLLEHGLLKIKH